jgi:adenylosuccinate lyase
MAAVWSDEARLTDWLEIEILAVEAWAELGQVPVGDARAIRSHASFTVEDVMAAEQVTRHRRQHEAEVGVNTGPIGDPVLKPGI